jgi:hypothetical protein
MTAQDPAATARITIHPHGELTTYFGRSYGGVPVTIPPGRRGLAGGQER